MPDPTLRQREVMVAIHTLTKRLGRAPSIAELGDECGFSDQPYAIRNVLKKLERDGLALVPHMVVTGELTLTAAGRRAL
jgi:SOS-response transcriptional repressor LexA